MKPTTLLLTTLVFSFLYFKPAYSQIQITQPFEGEKVGKVVQFKGTAVIDSSKFLWVLCYRLPVNSNLQEELTQIKPVTVKRKNNRWRTALIVGGIEDVGRKFRLVALSVDLAKNEEFKLVKANLDNQTEPIPYALFEAETFPMLVTVSKDSHE